MKYSATYEIMEEMNLPFTDRPLSWSAISSFEYSKEQWYNSYVLGKRSSSPELEFGSKVDKRIQNDPTFLPELPRYPLMQHKMNVVFSGIPLVGITDGLDLDTFLLADYKTGRQAWTHKRAKDTGQLTMYLLLIYITYKIPPEKFRCFIHWLPTKKEESGDFDDIVSFIDQFKIETFEIKRTMNDLLKFGARIVMRYKEMQDYAAERLSPVPLALASSQV